MTPNIPFIGQFDVFKCNILIFPQIIITGGCVCEG